jgi:hypothetical protein
MHQQLWGYKVEWKSVSRGTGGKKVEYHWSRLRAGQPRFDSRQVQGRDFSSSALRPDRPWNPIFRPLDTAVFPLYFDCDLVFFNPQ